jgi:hypothetical protein
MRDCELDDYCAFIGCIGAVGTEHIHLPELGLSETLAGHRLEGIGPRINSGKSSRGRINGSYLRQQQVFLFRITWWRVSIVPLSYT